MVIMALSTQPYKGARDFYPEDKRLQKWMFGKMRQVVESFGYQEYDAPILEPVDIFLAKTGEEIVNDQLYSFTDRADRRVAIRPEMTPSVSRMVAARRQELAYPLRWYSIPNLWRYERPQRGRLREHWQLNVDIFGVADISADHEIILIAEAIMQAFKSLSGSYSIRINSRMLLDHFLREVLKFNSQQAHDTMKLADRFHKIDRSVFEAQAKELLDDKSRRQLIELLNCDDIQDLPAEVTGHPSVQELEELFELLSASDVKSALFDFSVVRGMDYYDDIIFEVFDEHPDNNRSMFGGGRYDGLVGLFGVEPVPTVGFGMGDVTLQNFLAGHKLLPELKNEVDAAVILIGDIYKKAQKVLSAMRANGLNVALDSTDRKLDAKIKSAVKAGVKYAIFIGEEELKTGKLKVKNLDSGEKKQLTVSEITTIVLQ